MLPCLIESLRKVLQHRLPNIDQRKTYAADLAYGRYRGPAPTDAKRAAVLVLLHGATMALDETESKLAQYHFPLTLRVPHLTRHGGQVSLPGGALGRGERPWQAAVRETEEELGVHLAGMIPLGELAATYVFTSNFLVTPCVGFLPFTPTWSAQESEVADIFDMSLQYLLHPDHFSAPLRERHGVKFHSPCIHYKNHQIWGATGVILGELIAKIRSLLSESSTEKGIA